MTSPHIPPVLSTFIREHFALTEEETADLVAFGDQSCLNCGATVPPWFDLCLACALSPEQRAENECTHNGGSFIHPASGRTYCMTCLNEAV